jgi:CHAT domain-containing protein
MLNDTRWRGTEKAAPAKAVKDRPAAGVNERTPPYYWAAFVLAGDWR